MMINIDDALEICLAHLEAGDMTAAECLALFPQHASELAPLLDAVQALYAVPPIEALPPARVEALEKEVLARTPTPAPPMDSPTSGVSTPWLPILLAVASIIVILLGLGAFYNNHQDSDSVASAPITPLVTAEIKDESLLAATESPLVDETLVALATMEESEPSIAVTAPPEIAAASNVPAIFIEMSGVIEDVDEEARTIQVNGMQVEVDLNTLPDTISTEHPTVLQVAGTLQDDGTITDAIIQQSDDAPASEALRCPMEDCHPILLILADAYSADYSALDASFHDNQLGIGEIARALAIADGAGVDFATILAQRENGTSWDVIVRDYARGNVAPGVIIRQGDQAQPSTQQPLPAPSDHPGNSNTNGQSNGNGNANGNRPAEPPGQGNGNSNGNRPAEPPGQGNGNGNKNGNQGGN